jgi:hypothetical protein
LDFASSSVAYWPRYSCFCEEQIHREEFKYERGERGEGKQGGVHLCKIGVPGGFWDPSKATCTTFVQVNLSISFVSLSEG